MFERYYFKFLASFLLQSKEIFSLYIKKNHVDTEYIKTMFPKYLIQINKLYKRTKQKQVVSPLISKLSTAPFHSSWNSRKLEFAVRWLTRQCGRPETECRHVCMRLVFNLCTHLPGGDFCCCC